MARRTLLNQMRTIENVVRAICGDELARTALDEAAQTLLVRSRQWSSLRAWGMKIARRRGMARARVAVARKLAVVLHRMWRDGSPFRFGQEPAVTAAA